MTGEARVKVLYVAGFSRCGSTLLGSLLGQLDGFFNLGEARMIWQRSLIDDRHCGCGVQFSECDTWRRIMDRFQSVRPGVPAAAMAEAVGKLTRTRSLPITSRVAYARNEAIRDAGALEDAVTALYESVQVVTGARVLIDTSKVPMYAYMLRHSGLDVRVAHLVRDPRAVAVSRLIPKQHVDQASTMGGVSIFNTAVTWNLVNGSIERLLSDSAYLRLGYRQMIEQPAATLRSLAHFMGESATLDGWLSDQTANLTPTHSVYGNPGRFSSGAVQLAVDERWRSLEASKALAVSALTMRGRYRYRQAL